MHVAGVSIPIDTKTEDNSREARLATLERPFGWRTSMTWKEFSKPSVIRRNMTTRRGASTIKALTKFASFMSS